MHFDLYKDLLGAEFEMNGRGPKYDCYGLVKELSSRLGRELPDYQASKSPLVIHEVISHNRQAFQSVNKPEPGDLILFTITPPFVSHVTMAIDEFRFIHIMRGSSVTIERFDVQPWSKRIKGYLRWVK